MTTTTAALVLLLSWAGALAGAAHPVPKLFLLLTVGTIIISLTWSLILLVRSRGQYGGSTGDRPGMSVTVAMVIALTAGCTAGLGAAVRTQSVQAGPLAAQVEAGSGRTAVTVRMTAVSDVGVSQFGGRWLIGRLQFVHLPGAQALISRERVVIRLTDDAGVRPEFGATYDVEGVGVRIPDQAGGYWRTLGATIFVDAVQVTAVRDPPSWQRLTTRLRTRTADAAALRLAPDQAVLLTGLVTGDVSGQSVKVAEDVKATGLSHLVAVSGSNVAVVVAAVMGLCLLAGVGRRVGWWAAGSAVWWFVVLVRAEPSVVRAAVMATLVLGAMIIGRVRSTVHLLCTAGILALLADPMLAGRVGFVLSMAATAGVVVLAPVLDALLQTHTRLPRLIRLVLAASCGAQVAVAPILLRIGGEVHPATIPANLIAVPAAGIASMIGGISAVLSMWWPWAAGHVAALARPALWIILWTARWFGSGTGRLLAERMLWAVLAVVLVKVGTLARHATAAEGKDWHRAALAATALVVVTVASVVMVGGNWPGAARAVGLPTVPTMVVLDVGQGDAILLGDPSAGWLLVDTGPDPSMVASVLRRRGIDRLAALVLTHPHADHTDGAAAVIRQMPVAQVLQGPGPAEEPELLAALANANTPLRQVAAGDQWDHGAMHFRVLSPPITGLGEEPNENSVVIRVDVEGGRSILLTGDAERLAQSLLLREELIDVDILKVPHHGGNTNSEGFLAATTPQVAVISSGADNTFGHPHPDVLVDLADIEVHRTDLEGDVVVPLVTSR